MNRATTEDFRLPYKGLLSMDGDLRGTRITCRSGVIWLTQEGDFRDYILKAGRELTISRKGKVLIQSLGEALFTITS